MAKSKRSKASIRATRIANLEKARIARVANMQRRKAEAANLAEPVARSVAPLICAVDSDGIIHSYASTAAVWPHDREGTTAVQVGKVLVLVKRED